MANRYTVHPCIAAKDPQGTVKADFLDTYPEGP